VPRSKSRILKHTGPTPSDRTSASHRRYFLGELVFACATRHGVVLLDLKCNRYLAVGCLDSLSLSECVEGFPRNEHWADSAAQTQARNSPQTRLLESLVDGGILAAEKPATRDIVCADIALDGDLVSIGEEIMEKCYVRATDVVSFLIHFLGSAASLRCRPLRSVVRRVYRRRCAAIASGYTFNLSRASELVDKFRSIRPYVFLARDNCLLHALALVNYLAAHGEFPAWVFGVTTDPWTAHSWVQQERFLLDSSPEAVCSLEPILAV